MKLLLRPSLRLQSTETMPADYGVLVHGHDAQAAAVSNHNWRLEQ